ncbi:MAG: hypothetical protein PUB60_05500 [Veillonellaceae bacterium]|nr:hypothetical protein [Veillonellaceae bacterium]
MNNNPIILNGLLGSVRQPFFAMDGKTAADVATMNGVQQENYAQQNRDALAELTGMPLPMSQTDQQAQADPQTQDVPEAAGEAAATATARATGNPNAAAEAGNAAVAATANATQAQDVQTAQNLAQGLLGPYAADTPAQRAFDAQLYDSYVKPQMDAAFLPYREAQYAANDAAIRRAHPDTVMGAKRQLVDGLAQAKAAYDSAKAAGNEQGMALAHQAAEQLRQQAAAIGFDLGAYGGDSDTNAMVQALANNDARAYAAVIDNDMAPEQYYQQLYNRARNSGMGRKESEGYAQAHTEQYQAERNARMQSAFYTYGIQNGAITPYGMQILTKWAAGEDPQAFLGITTKAFGLPIDEYKLGNQRTLLSDQNKYTMTQNEQKHGFNMQEIGLKGQIEAQIHALDGQIKSALAKQQFGYAQELQRQRLAAQAYLKSLGGGGGSSSSSKSGDGKPLSEAMQTKLLNARDLYEKEKGSLSNVQDTIDALDKIKGEISDDDARDAINAMEYALNARREAVSWNDHGESGGKQNFIDYYDAVANAGYPELVSDLSALYDRAKNG